jgi:soluble lytic murein transglycosylase-like protein
LEADAWTAATHQAIDGLAPTLLSATPRDIEAFCPGYAYQDGAGRRALYVDLLAMIARQESNLDPAARFVEPTIRDAQGRNVVSTGLLQISQESANGYGCQITDQRQLEDGATNLRCGVRIAGALIQRDGLIAGYERGWKGAARYWAVLRDPAKLADLQQFTNTKPYCRRVVGR